MINCDSFKETMKKMFPNLFTCEVKGDYLRLTTPFFYPDGDHIDLFIIPKNPGFIITDMGETIRYLGTYDLNISSSLKRKHILNDVVNALDLGLLKGNIFKKVNKVEDIPNAVITISQAVIRISDIIYTAKSKSPSSFREEVRDFLEFHEINAKEGFIVTGGSGYEYELDFGIKLNNQIKLVRLITVQSPSAANAYLDKVVRIWYDISQVYPDKNNRISLFDDTSTKWKPEAINLIGQISEVSKWTEKEQFLEKIKIA